MASYPIQILDAPPQYGFIPGLASGMSSAGQTFGNAYLEALIKDKFDKRNKKKTQEEMSAYTKAMQEGGYELDSSTLDEEGNIKYTFKKKETPQSSFMKDPTKAIKQAMLGVGTENVGQALNIPPQQPLSQDAMSKVFPVGQMTGRQISAQGTPINYGDTVKKALVSRFAPGYTQEQVMREVMGLPLETAQEKMQAEKKVYDPAMTAKVQQNIKTPEDIEELLDNQKDYEDAGVDVTSVLRNYINSGMAEPSVMQKIMAFFGAGG
jgi:hypothetical protein